jgi:hypothetical protein
MLSSEAQAWARALEADRGDAQLALLRDGSPRAAIEGTRLPEFFAGRVPLCFRDPAPARMLPALRAMGGKSPTLGQSSAWIERCWPELFERIATLLTGLIPVVHGELESAGESGRLACCSGPDRARPGVVFATVDHPLTLANALVAEAAHLELARLGLSDPHARLGEALAAVHVLELAVRGVEHWATLPEPLRIDASIVLDHARRSLADVLVRLATSHAEPPLIAALQARAARTLARAGGPRSLPRLSRAEFAELERLPDHPLCIEGVVASWPAFASWTPALLRDRYGDIEVRVRRGYEHAPRSLRLADFIDALGERSDWYLIDWGFEHVDPRLLDDYVVPSLFRSWHMELPESERPGLRSIYLGPPGSGSRLHVDVMMTAAWNALIVGRKRWMFAAPEQAAALGHGMVDAFAPDLVRYPEFASAEWFDHVQSPGELLYTPSGWWHQVANLEASLALTENFVNQHNYRAVLECPWDREHEDLREVGAALKRSILRALERNRLA